MLKKKAGVLDKFPVKRSRRKRGDWVSSCFSPATGMCHRRRERDCIRRIISAFFRHSSGKIARSSVFLCALSVCVPRQNQLCRRIGTLIIYKHARTRGEIINNLMARSHQKCFICLLINAGFCATEAIRHYLRWTNSRVLRGAPQN